MPNLFDFLASRVGRRLVLLFGVCALIPLLSLAGLSYRVISDYLLTAGREELRAGSKSYAMSLMDRLQQLESALLDTTVQLDDGGLSPARRALLDRRFDWMGVASLDGHVETLVGPAESAPSRAELEMLDVRPGVATIQTAPEPLFAVALLEGHSETGMLVARLRPGFLWWGATEDNTLPANTGLLVLVEDSVLFSTLSRPRALADTILAERHSSRGLDRRAVDWRQGETESVAGFWTLPLSLQLTGEDWTVVWSRARSDVLKPVRQFGVPFALVLMATFLGVILLALWQIRRFLRPLEELRQGTDRLAGQDFSTAVQLSSRDEFGDLAHAFNDMAGHVGQALNDLRRHQLGTLSALAQAIDERSSWTLGHSGRVASLSRRIAEEMALPQHDVQTLQRAALLHDIGKLKVSTVLLEKPGSLTLAELEEMKNHVAAGVRILAPIPGYESICAIVEQHHERLDGSGYPQGLKGDEIALGAKILAVADSFDALSYDRPYRVGLSLDEALAEIQRCSGTLYEPLVVEAFNAVVRMGGLEATASLEMRAEAWAAPL